MNERFYSLDVFRGATVALMILVITPGNWSYIYSPLEHAAWHGCTPTDLVFPFFLFAVGNALAFVMPRFKAKGTSYFLKKVTKRSLLIFAVGLFLNWSPFIMWKDDKLVFKAWENIRIFGVLQRIALSYFFASLLVYFLKPRLAILISCLILISYWILCLVLGAAGDPYSMSGYFGTDIDKALFGANHLYKGEGLPFDPEGFTSTIAAIIQVVAGYFTGKYIREKGKTWEMLSNVFIAGILLTFVGFAWDLVFPINKKIWTSSYTIYTSGLALMVLGMFVYLIEFKQARGAWSRFFVVFGRNALFIFCFNTLFQRILALVRWQDHLDDTGKPVYITPLPWFYTHLCKPVSENLKNGSLLYAICMIFFYWYIVYIMDKRKIYVRL